VEASAQPIRGPRKSLTKKQLQTDIGVELLSLCQAITADGRLDEAEIGRLREWLSKNSGPVIPAISHLQTVIERVIADGKITHDEYREVHLAVEAILPLEIRQSARAQRRNAEIAEHERNGPIEYADFMIAGVRYEDRARTISRFVREGDIVALVRDLGNEFSKNAIQVRIQAGYQIGFVPEVDACVLAPLLDQGCKYKASVKKILGYGRVPIPVVIARLYRPEAVVEVAPWITGLSSSDIESPSPARLPVFLLPAVVVGAIMLGIILLVVT
jgi:HIRAN domain